MQSSVRHATAKVVTATFRESRAQWRRPVNAELLARGNSTWICAGCRSRIQRQALDSARPARQAYTSTRRHFGTSRALHDEREAAIKDSISSTKPASDAAQEIPSNSSTSTSSLPSHLAKREWQLSKDMTKFIDGLLAQASVAGQHINAYTGTDYTGIEVLRADIVAQEEKVRSSHTAVEVAQTEHHASVAKQAASQKEIVSLLERKSSWSPSDLERYMSLVRSEHTHDQDVQTAKDSLAAAERTLENARSSLEHLERKRYHEEQIWSDTIRRNSTWVTFGLMGVNIVLLLANILIFEPYRRKKIVRDMQAALDEKTRHLAPSSAETQIDSIVPAADLVIEAAEPSPAIDAVNLSGPEAQTAEAIEKVTEGLPIADPASSVAVEAELLPSGSVPVPGSGHSSWSAFRDEWQERFHDLFSERIVQIQQVELTSIALQGAATGVATMGLLFLIFKPR